MKRRLMLGPALSAVALVTAGVLLTTPAAAQGGASMKQYGWWLIAYYDPTLDQVPATSSYSGPDAADMHISYGMNPDAAEKQDTSNLVVNGPTEVSAVEFDLPDQLPEGVLPDIQVGTLSLAVDPTYTPTVSPQASLLACSALNPWTSVQGGNWQTKVTYDSQGACAPGNFNSSSNVFTFNITAGMVRGLQVADLAIVPGYVPLGCDVTNPANAANCAPNPSTPPQAPWRLELKPPVASNMTLLPVSGSVLGSGFSLPQESAATVPGFGGSLPALGPGGLGGGYAQPASGGGTASGAKSGYQVPSTLGANPTARLNALGTGRLIAAGLLLLLFLAGLLLMATDFQRLLTPGGQAAGIGRFARVRTGPPLPI